MADQSEGKNKVTRHQTPDNCSGTKMPFWVRPKRAILGLTPFGFLLLGSGFLFLTWLAYAATGSWTFTPATDYELSDSARIEIGGADLLRLKAQKPYWTHDSKAEFDSGTYSDTEYLNTTGLAGTTASAGMNINSSGLVAYWPLNGSDSDLDTNDTVGLEDTKSTYEGTANNVNSTGMAHATGRFGNGVNFDGIDDYISVSHNAALMPTTAISIAFWFKTTKNYTGAGGNFLNKEGASSGYLFRILLGGQVQFRTDQSFAYYVSSTSLALNNGAWHHAVATWNGSVMRLYIDGSLNANTSYAGPMSSNTNALNIGSGIEGLLDDIALWNRALTKDEIEALAAAGAAVHMEPQASITTHAPKLDSTFKGLISYWPMDNTSGNTIAADLVGTSSGAMSNFPVNPWVAGISGNGLDFDGVNDVVATRMTNSVKGLSQFTLSAWFKTDVLDGVQHQIYYEVKPDGTNIRLSLAIDGTTNRLRYIIRPDDSSNLPSCTAFDSATALATGTWYHTMVEFDSVSDSHKLYINGIAETNSCALAAMPSTDPASVPTIGRNTTSGSFKFDGVIDEVALFNRLLNANEILYLRGKKGEYATYTSPVMDGEITTATWDKITANFAKVNTNTQFLGTDAILNNSTARSVAAADLDNDGDQDLLGGNINASNIVFWSKNLGNGVFNEAKTNISTTVSAMDIAAADFTGDKNIDFVVADNLNGGVKWYKSDGAATPVFTEQTGTQITTDATPQTVAVGDIDNDGDIDVVAGFGGAVDKIVWYQSDGTATPTFTAQTAVATGFDAQHLVVQDINNDGFLDIAAASQADSKLTWYKGNGGSSWTATDINTTASTGWAYVSAADMDQDGDIDVISAGLTNGHISWWSNDGSATPAFSTKADLSTTYTSANTAYAADMDNDGDMDVITAAAAAADKLDWWQNNGSQSFTQIALGSANRDYIDVAVADFTGDGALDFFNCESNNSTARLYTNSRFKNTSITSLTNINFDWVVYKDIDADGDLDIAVANDGTTDEIGYHKQTSAGVFGSITNNQTCGTARSLDIEDVDNDGKLDMLAVCSDGLNRWIQGANADTWTKNAAAVDATVTTGRALAVALDGSRIDIVSNTGSAVKWWKQNETTAGQFDAQTDIEAAFANTNPFLKVADVDSDGDLDVIASSNSLDDIAWWAQTSTGVFGTKNCIDCSFATQFFNLGDLDNDGDLDIVAGTGVTTPGLHYWLQTAPGTFGTKVIIGSGSGSWQYPNIIDIDGDGDNDIIVSVTGSGVRRMHLYTNLGSLTFSKSFPFNVNGRAWVIDVDQDGLKDLFQYDSGILYFLQQQAGSTIELHARTHTADPPTTTFVGSENSTTSTFGSASNINSNLDSKRYLQWKATFFRNDSAQDPTLKNVRLDYTANAYTTLKPYASPLAATTFSYLTSFAENTPTTPAGSDIKYALSQNAGSTWRWYSGGWTTSDGTYAQANDASTISTNIATFDNNLTANGSLTWRAFMNSNGTAQPSLDGLTIGYEAATLTVAQPNATSDVWKVGDAQLVGWTLTGDTVPDDLTLEYNTAGSTTVFDNTIATNVGSNHHNEELMTGAVAVYHFGTATSGAIANGATSGLEDTKSTNEGTASNANASGMAFTSGRFGGGVDLDGTDDAVNVPDAVALDFGDTADFSISGWFNRDTANTDDVILAKRDGIAAGNVGYIVYVDDADDKLYFEVSDGTDEYQLVSSSTFTSTGWNHFAVVWDQDSVTGIKIYVNGAYESASITGNISNVGDLSNALALRIGSESDGGNPFDGKLDEIALFNRTLTSTEAAALAKTNPGYVWTVADQNSTTVRVRVKSAGASTISDVSNANSTITDFNIAAPNGTEFWKVGDTTKSITWTSDANTGIPSDFILEYTTSAADPTSTGSDPLTTWVEIANTINIQGVSSQAWNPIPDQISSTARVRLRSPSVTTLTDTSNANFTIADVAILLPNGGETVNVNDNYAIDWAHGGTSLTDFILEYDYGSGWTAFTPAANSLSGRRSEVFANSGYNPALIAGAQGVWRMEEAAGTSIGDSAGSTTGTLTLGSGGNTTVANAWVNGQFGKAIDFDGTDDYIDLGSGAAVNPTGTATIAAWIYADAVSGAYRIFHNHNGVASSNLFFSVSASTLTLSWPTTTVLTSKSTLSTGTWYHVVGTRSGSSGNWTAAIYINGMKDNQTTTASNPAGGNYASGIGAVSTVAASYFNGKIDDVALYNVALSAANIRKLAGGSYKWVVEDHVSTTVKVRIRSASATDLVDASDTNFIIDAPTVTVVAPNGTEIWPYNTVQYITWTPTGLVSNNLSLAYDTASGTGGYGNAIAANGIDPGGKPFTGAIAAWGFGEGTSTSLADKSGNLNTGTLNLGSGGNTTVANAWNVGKFGYSVNFDGVDDYVSTANLGSGVKTLSFWIKADDTTSRKILNIDGTDQVELDGSSNILATSFPGTTTIYVDGVASAALPNTNWHHVLITDSTGVTGSSFEIGRVSTSYFDGSIDEVHVYNRVLTAAEIALLATGRGIFPWTIPDPGFTSSVRSFPSVRVRVRDENRTATVDDSNANMSLVTPRFVLTAPPPPAAVAFGVSQNITWTHADATDGSPVSTDRRIEYSVDGTSWPGGAQVIVTDSAGYGGPVNSPVNFSFPSGAVSNTVKVRIRDNAFPWAEGISSTFKVTGSFVVQNANGGEKWAAGFLHTIRWQRNGNIANAKIITYDTDPATPVTTITSSTDASTGQLDWTPTASNAKTGLKLRISDAADADVYDDSANTFIVSTVAAGNPAARILAGSAWTISWTHTGLTNVKLERSILGDFTDAVNVVASTSAAALSYDNSGALTVPLNTTATFKIRASDPDVPGVGDTSLATDNSDANTTIYGNITLGVPNGGESVPASQPYDITWTVSPAGANVIPFVKIQAAKNGNFLDGTGGNIVTIISSTASNNNPGNGTGKYSWTPAFTGSSVKLRISDANDPSPVAGQDQDDSNNTFSVTGIAIESPAGGETALVNSSFGVTFNYAGTLNNVDFHYSPDGGGAWNVMTGIAGCASGLNCAVATNPQTFTWNNVADDISINAKIRVRDTANPSTIYAISPVFNIKGVIAVTTPGSLLNVGDPYTIQWQTNGSMPNQRVEFSKSGNFSGDEIVIANLTGLSGAMGNTAQSTSWSGGVGDQINNNTGKFRVTNTTTHTNGSLATSGLSGTFSIGAKFAFTTPIGSTTWAVNESNRTVVMTKTGTVANIKLDYLAENDSYAAVTGIVGSVGWNSGNYLWNPIPDIVTLRGQAPQTNRDILVKVRVSDADAGHPAAPQDSAAFIVKYYQITWHVRDVVSAAHLSALDVTDVNGVTTIRQVTDNTLTSPNSYNYQYATYTSTWGKDNYLSGSLDNWLADSDKTLTLYMVSTSVTTNVNVSFAYDGSAKTGNFTAWIIASGKPVTGGGLGTGTIEIYDGPTIVTGGTLSDTTPDANGLYQFTYNNNSDTLVSGKSYTAKGIITFSNAPQIGYQSFSIPNDSQILANTASLLTNVAAVQSSVNTVDTKLGTTSDAASASTLFGKVKSLTDTVGTATDSSSVDSLYGKIAAQKADVTTIKEEILTKVAKKTDVGKKSVELLNRNVKVLLGSKYPIRVRAGTAAQPKVTIYDGNNKSMVSAVAMTAGGTTGTFYYSLDVSSSTFAKGIYVIKVTDTADSSVEDSTLMEVVGATEDKIAQSVAAAQGSASSASDNAKKAFDEVLALKTSLGGDTEGGIGGQLTQMSDNLGYLRRSMYLLTGGAEGSGSGQGVTIETVNTGVKGVLDAVVAMASQKGVNLDAVYGSVASQEESVKGLQNMVAATQAAVVASQEILEKAQSQPILSTWFEAKT